jgi:hypothetical protein
MLRQRRLVVGLRMTSQHVLDTECIGLPLALEQLLGNNDGLLRIP